MAAAAILKNPKIVTSQAWCDQLQRNLTLWRSFTVALMQTEIAVTSGKSNVKGKQNYSKMAVFRFTLLEQVLW